MGLQTQCDRLSSRVMPVVLTTGYSDAAQAVPPDLPILRKPFDTDALRSFMQDMMDVS